MLLDPVGRLLPDREDAPSAPRARNRASRLDQARIRSISNEDGLGEPVGRQLQATRSVPVGVAGVGDHRLSDLAPKPVVLPPERARAVSYHEGEVVPPQHVPALAAVVEVVVRTGTAAAGNRGGSARISILARR